MTQRFVRDVLTDIAKQQGKDHGANDSGRQSLNLKKTAEHQDTTEAEHE